MSIDASIDEFFNAVVNMMKRGALVAAPYLLAAFALAMDLWGQTQRQIIKSLNALQNSFTEDSVIFYFLEGNGSKNMWVPVASNTLIMDLDKDSYVYSPSRKVFSYKYVPSTEIIHMCHIPFIGASVCRITDDGQERDIYDLSEWIQEQRILSSQPRSMIPLQVLVGAWAHYAQVRVSHGFKNMRLSVMTEEGDEKVFDLETEEERVAEVTHILPPSPAGEVVAEAETDSEEEDNDSNSESTSVGSKDE